MKVRFTKDFLDDIEKPLKGLAVFKDDKEPGLAVYVTPNGVVTFYLRKRIDGRDEKITIGPYPDLSIDQARRKCQEIKGQVASGKNPHREHIEQQRAQATFGDLFERYMTRHSKRNKKSWRYDEREVERFLSKWLKRRASTITKEEVREKLDKIRDENGPYQANRILERIRSIFNKNIEWGWKGENPAKGIKKNKEKSRDRFVLPSEMPYLLKSINEDENQTVKDVFYMLLLTGARKTNTLMMQWEEIDFDLRHWRIPDTKNGEPQTVAVVDQAMEILKRRRQRTNSLWVFPQDEDAEKHYSNIKRAWTRIVCRATIYLWLDDPHQNIWVRRQTLTFLGSPDRVVKQIAECAKKDKIILLKPMTDIRIHDIRRTFGSYQALAGASLQVIGKSLGHKSQQATQVYARLNLDPIRSSIEKSTQVMFGLSHQQSEY